MPTLSTEVLGLVWLYDGGIRSRPDQSARMIRLRRPAILSVSEGIFVPEGEGGVLDEVERRWRRCCTENPAFFDGRIWHVLGLHRNGYGGAVIHVMDCAYRFHAVQDEAFDLGMRALGVKGFVMRRGRVLMGRRSAQVNAYHGLWEFAPGGVVETGTEPAHVIASELREETALSSVRDPTPIAVLYDDVLRCWEIIYRIAPGSGEPIPAPKEYDELRWCAPDDLPRELTPIAKQMTRLLESTPG